MKLKLIPPIIITTLSLLASVAQATPNQPPEPTVKNLTVEQLDNSSAIVDWQNVDNTETSEGYWINLQNSDTGVIWPVCQHLVPISGAVKPSNCILDSLATNVPYVIYVAAQDTPGISLSFTLVTQIPPPSTTVPPKPNKCDTVLKDKAFVKIGKAVNKFNTKVERILERFENKPRRASREIGKAERQRNRKIGKIEAVYEQRCGKVLR